MLASSLYVNAATVEAMCAELRPALGTPPPARTTRLGASVPIQREEDISSARVTARGLAEEIGFGSYAAVKIATAVSEFARNIFQYARTGLVEMKALGGASPGMEIVASDSGPAIENLASILGGTYQSRTGLGLGLRGSKKLMDEFDVDTQLGRGTVIHAVKYLDARVSTPPPRRRDHARRDRSSSEASGRHDARRRSGAIRRV